MNDIVIQNTHLIVWWRRRCDGSLQGAIEHGDRAGNDRHKGCIHLVHHVPERTNFLL